MKEKENLDLKPNETVLEIDVSEEIKDDVVILWDFAFIFHFIGITLDCATIKSSIKENWETEVLIRFLPKGFFLVVLADEKKKLRITKGDLWTMDGKPLYMQSWHYNFDSFKMRPYDNLVWVKLYNLLVEYWVGNCLEKIV